MNVGRTQRAREKKKDEKRKAGEHDLLEPFQGE